MSPSSISLKHSCNMKINHIVRAFTTSLIVGMALVACSKGYEYVPAAAEDNSKTVVSADMSRSAHYENTVAVTSGDPIILTQV